MPHVIVKLWPGKSEQQKNRLAEAITKDVTDFLHYGEESVWVPGRVYSLCGPSPFHGAPGNVTPKN
jgi:hypothetical protein